MESIGAILMVGGLIAIVGAIGYLLVIWMFATLSWVTIAIIFGIVAVVVGAILYS